MTIRHSLSPKEKRNERHFRQFLFLIRWPPRLELLRLLWFFSFNSIKTVISLIRKQTKSCFPMCFFFYPSISFPLCVDGFVFILSVDYESHVSIFSHNKATCVHFGTMSLFRYFCLLSWLKNPWTLVTYVTAPHVFYGPLLHHMLREKNKQTNSFVKSRIE